MKRKTWSKRESKQADSAQESPALKAVGVSINSHLIHRDLRVNKIRPRENKPKDGKARNI